MAKILVIDDEKSICETLEMYLTEEGYEVYTANTGTEGLNKAVQIDRLELKKYCKFCRSHTIHRETK